MDVRAAIATKNFNLSVNNVGQQLVTESGPGTHRGDGARPDGPYFRLPEPPREEYYFGFSIDVRGTVLHDEAYLLGHVAVSHGQLRRR